MLVFGALILGGMAMAALCALIGAGIRGWGN
jgi:hypothetical protein